METPDATVLDLADLISGVAYPEMVKPVFLDEAAAFEVSQVQKAIDRNPTNEDLQKEYDEVLKKAASSQWDFHLRGVSRGERREIIESVFEVFPLDVDAFGRPKPNPKADELLTDKLWAAHIVKIVRADQGVIPSVSEADARLLRAKLPDWALQQIDAGINSLTDDSAQGFEAIVTSPDFLSRRSPEA